jgi:fructose-1,6-bisphosphatase/inositol monophosphatase family enzyme
MTFDKELAFAKELALEAGKIMQRYFRSEDIAIEWKEDESPVTAADKTINALVIEKVKQQFPSYGVIGEEDSFNKDAQLVWIVDPVDGTVPFKLGMPLSTFCLAFVDRKDGQPLVAVNYDPQLNNLYHAVKGRGAFLNGDKIATSNQTELSRGHVFLWHDGNRQRRYYDMEKLVRGLAKQNATHISVPSGSYFAVRIASGELLGSLVDGGSPWDTAAIALIVSEAGGVITALDGQPRRYDEYGDGYLFAANKTIHQTLLSLVKDSAP